MPEYAVIIDFSFLWYQCNFAALNAGERYNVDDVIVHNVKGKLRTIKRVLEKHRILEYDIIFAEDRSATRKTALMETYRAGRTNNSDAKSRLKHCLLADGFKSRFCYSEGNEADDVIATLVALANKNGGIYSVIVTGDRDLWQLMNSTTVVLNPLKKEIVTNDDVIAAFSVGPSHVALFKTLWGDASDCVPNAVPRTQRYLLPLIRQSDGTYEHFKRLVEENWHVLPDTCKDKYQKGKAQCEINWQLVRLDPECPLQWD